MLQVLIEGGPARNVRGCVLRDLHVSRDFLFRAYCAPGRLERDILEAMLAEAETGAEARERDHGFSQAGV